MTPEDRLYCHRLMEATDEFLSRLEPSSIKGAINWADLQCVQVERVETFDETDRVEAAYRVIIEEASPDSYQLAAAVSNALAGAGFTRVEVHCEW